MQLTSISAMLFMKLISKHSKKDVIFMKIMGFNQRSPPLLWRHSFVTFLFVLARVQELLQPS